MYIHTHWAYNHPYAARTWTLTDWQGYLEGLAALGYDFIMIWPQFDSMPPEPRAGDRAYLETIAQVIELAHRRFGMRVAVVACANTIGNAEAASYTFRERPYFICEKKVDPKDNTEVAAFLRGRRRQFEGVRNADALVVIDSDPGGYIGSTNREFVDLVQGQAAVFRELNPALELIYWMFAGWESYNRFWADTQTAAANRPAAAAGGSAGDFIETLSLIRERIPEPWSVFASFPAHQEALQRLGLRGKAMWFPYGLVEEEPSFPLTNCSPATLAGALTANAMAAYPRGFMANAQTHCLQLPHTCLAAHFAGGDRRANADLAGFAEGLLPGRGAIVARGWRAIQKRDPASQRAAAAALRSATGQRHPSDHALAGLLFGDADRFLSDLAMNLEVRAELIELKTAVGAGCAAAPKLRRVLDRLRPYWRRVGFSDAYIGPLRAELNDELARLNDAPLDAVLQGFADWRDPSIHHGIVPRLLDALDGYCRRHGA